jgi:hypothetical protein
VELDRLTTDSLSFILSVAVQAMLYATDGIRSDDDFNKAMVGVASVWCMLILRQLSLWLI